MENLTKEVILQAIQRIKENPELIKGRESSTYDLIHEGKKFPPILVLSEANKIIGGKEVKLNDFGNNVTKAFKILENFHFVVEKKKSTEIIKNGKDEFLKFLSQRHKNIASSNQYVNGVEKAQKWFIQKGICDDSFNVWMDKDKIEYIDNKLNNEFKKEWKQLNTENHYWYGSPWKAWVEFNQRENFEEVDKNPISNQVIFKIKRPKVDLFGNFDIKILTKDIIDSGLIFSEKLIIRFVSSLLTKPFVILTGLSGSGKTKLAQAFTKWICKDENQFCIVPVGADWTNREPLLGYPNALKPDEYVKPDNGVLDLIIRANKNKDLPYFLILDEMNLSHVERYFADFLSVMESGEEIPLFAEGAVNNGVPAKLNLPNNLFIIGTVNIDETTYMFSPKVLDRANTIEFRVNANEIEDFLNNNTKLNVDELTAKGSSMAGSFLELSKNKNFDTVDKAEINEKLLIFFKQLKKAGAEFGYRSANEIIRLINQLTTIDSDLSTDEKLDIAIMQKLLPKLHGSRRKLCPVLITLGGFCVNGKVGNIEKQIFDKDEFDFEAIEMVKYPLSLEKITRMYKGAIDNGFASYAEA